MKNAATILADAPTTSLKLAYSYLIPVLDQPRAKAQPSSPVFTSKKSIYKSPFTVHPSIAQADTWDAAWFNHYE